MNDLEAKIAESWNMMRCLTRHFLLFGSRLSLDEEDQLLYGGDMEHFTKDIKQESL